MSILPNKSIWDRLNNSTLVRFLLFFASGWALIQILDYFETAIVVFTLGAILAFLLSYPARSLRRFLPHGLAVVIVFLFGIILVCGLTVTLGVTLLSQGQQLIDSITDFLDALAPLATKLESFLEARNLQVNLHVIEEQLRNQALAGVISTLAVFQVFLTNLINLILIFVVAFFMLLDGGKLWQFILNFIPKNLHKKLNTTIERSFLGFFRGQLLLMLFLMTSTLLFFLAFQVRFALLLAIIIALFDMIPGIGATLGITLVTFIVLSQNVWLALKVLVVCIILQQIQDNLISPRIMQNSLNLNPVIVFLSLLIGARAAGLLGIFIAIPIAGFIVSWFEIEEMKSEPEDSNEVETLSKEIE